MSDLLNELQALRLEHWRQTPEQCIADPAAATILINQVGVITLFGVSSEIPDLYHAYTGDPASKPEESWDSPAGHIYTWRWELGRREAGFYGSWVRGKPTWISWELLPAILRLRADLRAAPELAGDVSENALRVLQALEDAGDDLRTGDLRQIADFPIGRGERAAYLKAVEELEARMLVAKTFSRHEGDTDMRHALVTRRYATHVAAARKLDQQSAIDRLISFYLPAAVYALPETLARHLRLPADLLLAGFERLAATGRAEPVSLGAKRVAYLARA